MVVLGGIASTWGAILGAVILTLLPELLVVFEDYEVLIFGAILMLIMIFLPQGLAGGLRDLWARRPGRDGALPPGPPAPLAPPGPPAPGSGSPSRDRAAEPAPRDRATGMGPRDLATGSVRHDLASSPPSVSQDVA